MTQLKQDLIDIAAEVLAAKGHTHLSAVNQIENILAYAASDSDFLQVTTSNDKRVIAELKSQIKYICSLGLDTAKGKKLVYVRTRNLNIGNGQNKVWLKMPDITESYHALIHVLVRQGAMKNVVPLHTFEGYQVEYSGRINDVPVVKSWATKPSDRGAYTGCFIVLYLPDGTVQTSYHHSQDIDRTHKAFSKSANTWAKHTEAMTAKSAILEATRYIPTFDEVVAEIIEHHDNEFDWDADPKSLKPRLTDDQVAEINGLISEYGIEKPFTAWMNKQLKVKTLDALPATAYDEVISKINANQPTKEAA